jgi:hypothetical protein
MGVRKVKNLKEVSQSTIPEGGLLRDDFANFVVHKLLIQPAKGKAGGCLGYNMRYNAPTPRNAG